MAELVPIQISELCPLNTRLLPNELCQAFGIADDSYDSREVKQLNEAHPQRRTEVTSSVFAASDAAEPCVGAAQQQPQAHEQQAAGALQFPPAGAAGQLPASTQVQAASAASAPAATAPTHPLLQAQSASQQQQQATSSISAGVQQQPALQAAAAVVGGPLRGIPAAYINPHSLLPYAQQTVAALPHLSGALPVTMYSPANISAVVALQQQQQQQQQSEAEAAEELHTRALKRPRLVWTPKLHKLFEQAVQKIGVNKAVPKTIMQLMNVEGLTRENVASHLQKYRLSLRKGPDGFISTVTEGTETSGAPPGSSSRDCVHKGEEQGSFEQTSAGAAGTAPAATATTTTRDMVSADPASAAGTLDQTDGTAGDGGPAAAAAEGLSSEAGTGAVTEGRGDGETQVEAEAETGSLVTSRPVVSASASDGGLITAAAAAAADTGAGDEAAVAITDPSQHP